MSNYATKFLNKIVKLKIDIIFKKGFLNQKS